MEEKRISKKALITFFTLVVLLSAVWEILYAILGNRVFLAILMWVPAFSAFVAAIVNLREKGEKVSSKKIDAQLGVRRCNIRYILMALVIPYIYLYIPYRIYWFMHPENYRYYGAPIIAKLWFLGVNTAIMVVASMLTATGEELGWRGFMLPALLERMEEKKAMLVVGLFWGLWHLPVLCSGGYMDGTPLAYRVVAFMLHIIPVCIIMSVLTIRSGSVWPAAVMHAAHNAYDQTCFQVITRGEEKMFFASETGIFTIICAWIIAIIMYVRYKKACDVSNQV